MSTSSGVFGIWTWWRADPQRRALIDADGAETTLDELMRRSHQIVNLLRDRGVHAGDNVAVMLPNGVDFLAVYLAALVAGMYFTPLNYHLMADEVAYVLQDCEAKTFVAHTRFAEVASTAAEEVGVDTAARLGVGGVDGFEELGAALAGVDDSEPTGRVLGERMVYTSGTTGRPKGIRRPLTRRSPDEAFATMPRTAPMFGLDDPSGVHLLAGPGYHSAPNSTSFAALHCGQAVVMMDKWSAGETLRLIDAHRVTNSHMVPTMFHRLVNLDDEAKRSFSGQSLRRIVHGAAPISRELKRRMIEWWGPIFYEYFGSTEVSGTGVDSAEWLAHPGTVGKPWPGVSLRVLDDDGNACPPGVAGHIFMRSEQPAFEYFKAPAKTDAARRDGYVTVGDIGYVDEEGRLYPCDRATNMIISGGVNIYPVEVENVLLEHPAVADVAVFGVPSAEWGEDVKAVVELREGWSADALEQELIEHCRARIAHLKCPKSVDFRDELPRGENGKSYKRLLRAEYWAGHDRVI